ncbi:MAG TPA: SCO family protein [Novosphingobium sp.]|nr:SCO family protein [Novosphingobium sp.]
MTKHFVIALTFGLLAACGSAPAERSPLEGASIGGDFELTDQQGKTVHWEDFAGKYRIVYFGYTYCPDACPTDVAVMIQGLNRFTRADPARGNSIQPIFITIDPERDTSKAMGEFAAAFSPRLIALTGTRAQVDVAKKAFKVYGAKGTESAGGYLMDHSRIAYLMGPDGKPISSLPIDQGPDAVAADLDKWVK